MTPMEKLDTDDEAAKGARVTSLPVRGLGAGVVVVAAEGEPKRGGGEGGDRALEEGVREEGREEGREGGGW